MPIFFQQDIDVNTRLAVWKIEEEENFFRVPLQRDITHPHKRRQHLAGRYLLRYLFPDFPLELIKIADTRKPYLEDEAFHFSISHCGDFAAAVVSKSKRVGVDIEVPSPKVNRIKHKFLHEEELASLVNEESLSYVTLGNPPESLHQYQKSKLTLLWSAKEAVFKWWSYGNVDFSEMIRLQSFELQPSGTFGALFRSKERDWPLILHYQIFDQLCLAWVYA